MNISGFRGRFTNQSNPVECQTECDIRYIVFEFEHFKVSKLLHNFRRAICGGWNYEFNENTGKGVCQLKSVNACCDQFSKRIESANTISGYICRECWSTRNECPCQLGKGLGSRFQSAAERARITNPTVRSTIQLCKRETSYPRTIEMSFLLQRVQPA